MRWVLLIAVVAFVVIGASRSAACALPWTTMEQVRSCGAPRYTIVSAGEYEAVIEVDSKSPPAVAAALAHAFVHEYEVNPHGFAVWSHPAGWRDLKYTGRMLVRMQSGLLQEYVEAGGPLHFDICTAWTDLETVGAGVGSVCVDQLEFWIEQ